MQLIGTIQYFFSSYWYCSLHIASLTCQISLAAGSVGLDSRCRSAATTPLVLCTANCSTTAATSPVRSLHSSTAISSILSCSFRTKPGMFWKTSLPLAVTSPSRTARTPVEPEGWLSRTASHRLGSRGRRLGRQEAGGLRGRRLERQEA